jgi:predicted RNase H-like HicB family nuclease
MEQIRIEVRARWDDEAKVWSASSDDVFGLVAEAATLDELVDVLDTLVPELVELNGLPHASALPVLPICIMAESLTSVRIPAA